MAGEAGLEPVWLRGEEVREPQERKEPAPLLSPLGLARMESLQLESVLKGPSESERESEEEDEMEEAEEADEPDKAETST